MRIEVGTTVLPKNAKFLVIFCKNKNSVVRIVEATGFLDETVLHVLQVEVCRSAQSSSKIWSIVRDLDGE